MPSGCNITANPYERNKASCVWVRARTSSASRRTKTSESEFTTEPAGPRGPVTFRCTTRRKLVRPARACGIERPRVKARAKELDAV